jgi:arylsulfatase A-like enzyme
MKENILKSGANHSNGIKRREFLRRAAIGGTAIAFSPILLSCRGLRKKPNIVYVFADQWRASAFGYTGDPNIRTPNIDRLAGKSMNFRNTVSVCPLCTPYRAALLTGRYPTSTGMFVNDLYLPSEELCMPELFSKAGYDTGYIGKWHLDGHGRSAFIPRERRQGWDYWKAAECDHNNPRSHYFTGDFDEKLFWEGYDAFAQTKDASQYIRDHAQNDNPFILMLSYGPPHPASPPAPAEFRAMYPAENIVLPPNVPEEYAEEARRHLSHYYSHGAALDRCVGELMQSVEDAGIADNTIFIFTSDHGGMLRSHGDPFEWKQVAWAESAQVPFLLRYPDAHGTQGRVIDTPLNTVDILPTLLALAGIDIPNSAEGDDLSELVTNQVEISDRSVLYMSVAPIVGQGDAHRSIRTSRYTYARKLDGPWLLFDDRQDPRQLNNLIGNPDYASLQKQLDEELQNHLRRIGDDFQPPAYYIDKWGYLLGPDNAIPYIAQDVPVQSPVGRWSRH